MTEELKSCPFCGSDRIEIIDNVFKFVTCRKCDVTGHEYYSSDEAIEAWNTRAGEKA